MNTNNLWYLFIVF